MRRIVTALCLAAVAALGTGCAAPGTHPDATPTGAETWTNYAADVVAVTPGPGDKAVTIAAKQPDGCARNLSVTKLSEEHGDIYASVGIDILRSASAPPGGCPSSGPLRATLSSGKAIGGRPGCTSTSAVRRYFLHWTPIGWGTLTRTTDGGCDAVLKAAPTFPRKLCSGAKPTAPLASGVPVGG